jgi:hypothetical protein
MKHDKVQRFAMAASSKREAAGWKLQAVVDTEV